MCVPKYKRLSLLISPDDSAIVVQRELRKPNYIQRYKLTDLTLFSLPITPNRLSVGIQAMC